MVLLCDCFQLRHIGLSLDVGSKRSLCPDGQKRYTSHLHSAFRPTGKNWCQVDKPIFSPPANTYVCNLLTLRMKWSIFTNMFPLKLLSGEGQLEVASVSFLRRLFVLSLFSTKQPPDTWNTHTPSSPVLSLCWAQRVTVAFGRCTRSKWPFSPSTLRESVSQIKEVVGLTEVSALP